VGTSWASEHPSGRAPPCTKNVNRTRVRPELASGELVPIDIKYKEYDAKKISTSDIYQTFLYAYALGDDAKQRRAGILYPTTSATAGPRLSIKPVSGPIAARIVGGGIDVPAALDALGGADPTLFDEVRTVVSTLTGLSTGPDLTAH
jgi:5-methylcytosine-specific restriction enzyme subunit McrC